MIMDLQKRKELKKKLYTIIFKTDTEEGKRFDIILLNVILLSVILAAIESVVAFNARYAPVFTAVRIEKNIFFQFMESLTSYLFYRSSSVSCTVVLTILSLFVPYVFFVSSEY